MTQVEIRDRILELERAMKIFVNDNCNICKRRLRVIKLEIDLLRKKLEN